MTAFSVEDLKEDLTEITMTARAGIANTWGRIVMAGVTSKSGIVIVSLILVGTIYSIVWAEPGISVRDRKAGKSAIKAKNGSDSDESLPHRMALAGEPLHLVFMGTIDVPAAA